MRISTSSAVQIDFDVDKDRKVCPFQAIDPFFFFCLFLRVPIFCCNTMHSITKFIVVALFGLMTSAIPTTPPTSPGGANPAVEPATKHVGASLPDGYGESYGAMRRLIKAADAHGNFKCATYAFIFARGTFDNPMETTAHVAETHKRGDEETAAEKPGEQKEIAAEKPEEEEETGPK